MSRFENKTFDTSTIQGLKAAERYKSRLENEYEKVTVVIIGLTRATITGQVPITSDVVRHGLCSRLVSNDEEQEPIIRMGVISRRVP